MTARPSCPQVLSEHQASHCVTPVSKIFDDNTDLSIDRFPLPDARPRANICEQRCAYRPPPHGRVCEARAGRLRPGWGPLPRLLPRHRPARVVLLPPPPTPDRIVPPLPQAPPSPDPPPHTYSGLPSDPHFPVPRPASTASFRGRALALTTPFAHQDAGPVAAPEHQQALPPAGDASAARERRDPRAEAPARGPP